MSFKFLTKILQKITVKINKRNKMKNNILDAILTFANDREQKLKVAINQQNRLHALGESLEEYIKDIFAGTLGNNDEERMKIQDAYFSYGGGKNNPPDAVIMNGDAIEVKKLKRVEDVPLNSSFPKAKLYKDDKRISDDCRNCEGDTWTEKDIIYAIGICNDESLSSMVLVYGSVYCAKRECYESMFSTIKKCISTSGYQLLEASKELAHINAVDPLGITYFRARGMWGISHPLEVFKYLEDDRTWHNHTLIAIIPSEKYESFQNKEIFEEKVSQIQGLKISDKQVKNPNNTAKLIDIKLITYDK